MNDEINEELFIFRKGTKYYKIENDDVHIIRIVNVKNSDTVVCMNDDLYTGKNDIKNDITFTMSTEDLKNNYRLLLPHGQLCMTKVTTQDNIQDVLIAVTKIETTAAVNTAASINFGDVYIICRQVAADIFAMAMNPNKQCFGICISRDTCPANINFDGIYSNCIPEKNSGQFINFYKQDSIDQILGLLKTKNIDDMLSTNYNKLKSFDPTIEGLEQTVEGLVKNNGLIYDIYKMFDIIPIQNVTIKYDNNSYILSDDDLSRIEYVIKCRISDILIVELNHFISEENLSEDYACIRICDSSGKIYLVQYTPVSGFAEELYPEEVKNGMANLLNKYQK